MRNPMNLSPNVRPEMTAEPVLKSHLREGAAHSLNLNGYVLEKSFRGDNLLLESTIEKLCDRSDNDSDRALTHQFFFACGLFLSAFRDGNNRMSKN